MNVLEGRKELLWDVEESTFFKIVYLTMEISQVRETILYTSSNYNK